VSRRGLEEENRGFVLYLRRRKVFVHIIEGSPISWGQKKEGESVFILMPSGRAINLGEGREVSPLRRGEESRFPERRRRLDCFLRGRGMYRGGL